MQKVSLTARYYPHEVLVDMEIGENITDDSKIKRALVQHARNCGISLERADLQMADLSEMDLSGMNFNRANLHGASLMGAHVSNANFERAELSRVRGHNAHGEHVNFRYAHMHSIDFTGASFTDSDFAHTGLSRAIFANAYLRGSDFLCSRAAFANFRAANLFEANLEFTDVGYAMGNGAELKTMFLDTYSISYTHDTLQIGCQVHPLENWWSFNDEQIDAMDEGQSLQWWTRMKAALQAIIAASPALNPKREA